MGSIVTKTAGFISRYFLYIVVIISLLVVVVIPVITGIIRLIRHYKKKNKKEILKVKIMSKRIFNPVLNTYAHETGISETGNDASAQERYYVAFETDEGKRFELAVVRGVYETLTEGIKGEIVVKGGECESFNWDK